MAIRTEASAEQAIRAVVDLPRDGQVADKVYVGRHPVLKGEGWVVGLTAVWEGAERLSEDPSVRCVVLEKNPNLLGLEKATLLRIDRVNGEGIERWDFVYDEGKTPVIAEDRQPLVQTVLNNITQLAVQPLSSFPQER